ncbi:hypothetical protein BG003_007111 [Podila horticola]|nr:hypothetical protein BG003_007111 [Podila horticola]
MFPPKSSRQFVPLPGQEYATPVPPSCKLPVDQYGKPRLPLTPDELEEFSKPKVLISGGGIGGLTLALLLHKANIPFLVLERAKEIKPLGASIGLGATVAPLLIQLGIYDEFISRAKLLNGMNMLKEDLTLVHTMDNTCFKELGVASCRSVGYGQYVISRPDLYDLLFNSIPRERILLGKRVLSLIQNQDSVMVRCSDNSSYYGDILVGADGAYSAVRQNLYKSLKHDKKLPASDDVSLPFNCVCLVGQTEVLDPEEFPHLDEELCHCDAILGVSTMCTWATATTKQNTVCWMVIHFLDKDSSKRNDSFRNSEWGSEAAEALAREVRPFKVAGGKDGKVLTLGDYIDRTPKHLMSKMSPAGGAGAVLAIHDAVTLANWFSTLQLATDEDLNKVFEEYRTERYPVAKEAFVTSQMSIRNLGKNMMASFVRGMIKRLPRWLWRRIIIRMMAARHQASFLPLVEDNAKSKPLYQRSLHKTLAIHRELAKNRTVMTTENNVSVSV